MVFHHHVHPHIIIHLHVTGWLMNHEVEMGRFDPGNAPFPALMCG
jgi:hypothetical protein